MSDSALSASANPFTEQVSTEVVTAVADAKCLDPTDLPPLYDAIDPDALDRLFRSEVQNGASGTVKVQFTFAGCDVVVDTENRVTVTPTDSGAERDFTA